MTAIDAAVLLDVMSRFGDALEEHREELDSLNVFPVPDGDTGTNLALTQRAVREALEREPPRSLGDAGPAISRASLMGARGNSGVILAQFLRGFCDRLCANEAASAAAVAEALERGAEEARRAVATPVEGTALTVLSEAADGARDAGGGDVTHVALAALEASRKGSERTREALPELREAGVVDAGGRGMVLFFDALWSVLAGRDRQEAVGPMGPVGRAERGAATAVLQKYEVMYLWEGPGDSVAELSRELEGLGDSVVVVGGGGLFKVHVHTNQSDAAPEAGSRRGSVRDVRVVDLEAEVSDQCVAGQARGVRAFDRQVSSLIAVADGDGVADLFASLGAAVVRGGFGEGFAADDLIRAIDSASGRSVLVLPNDADVLAAAGEAAESSPLDVGIVAARSISAGLAAAAAYNPVATREENERSMGEAIEAARAGSIRRATGAGDEWLGLVDGEAVEAGSEPAQVAARLVPRLRSPDHEILTVIVGADPSERESERVLAALRDAASGMEVEVHHGGQPRDDFLIGLE